ncbi:MAG TPA: hypothetical protein VGI60_04115 [Chthoniobacterales bacterium]|jgi:hypothetical protein
MSTPSDQTSADEPNKKRTGATASSEILLEPKDVRGPWTLLIYLIQHPRRILSAGLHLLLLALILVIVAGIIACGALKYAGIDPLTFLYARTKTPLAGLMDFSRRSDSQDSFKWSRLAEVQHEVFFSGVALHVTLGDHVETIRKNLQKGVIHRFLIADPTGKHFASNAAMFSGPDDFHQQQIATTIAGYETLKSELDAKPDSRNGTIELRLLDAPFPQACYFFDPAQANGSMILVTRLPRLGAPEMPALVFGRMPGGLLEIYYTEWNKLWSKAVPFEQWSADHPNYKPPGPAADAK